MSRTVLEGNYSSKHRRDWAWGLWIANLCSKLLCISHIGIFHPSALKQEQLFPTSGAVLLLGIFLSLLFCILDFFYSFRSQLN